MEKIRAFQKNFDARSYMDRMDTEEAIRAIFESSSGELEESHSNSEPDGIIDDPVQSLGNESISNSGESLLVDANYTSKDGTEKWFEHLPLFKRRTHAENIFRGK
ncbi:MAG: hypothetical protein MHMPM18_003133 [Marteilia pararefringens]